MTDEELLQLVDTKSPGELSLDEIQVLRTRLAESAELRTAFSSRLRLQTFLAEVLARIDLAPDDVLRVSSQERHADSRGAMWGSVVKRFRKCKDCGYRFKTWEIQASTDVAFFISKLKNKKGK